MALIAVTYVKGRGGATTVATGLAAVAPLPARPVVVECDLSGGDLMRRHRLAARPSIVDLAAAIRAGATADPFAPAEHDVTLYDRSLSVVAAPPGGAQTGASLPELVGTDPPALNPPDRLVLADCGRWSDAPTSRRLLDSADVTLVLARARTDEVAHLREHLGELLDTATRPLMVVLAPGGVYTPADVHEVLTTYTLRELATDPRAVSVWGPLPQDPRAAAILDGNLMAGRRWRRLPLFTGLSRLLDDLAPHLAVGSAGHRKAIR